MYLNPHIIACNYPSKRVHTFTGKERDAETGFSYFGARYYDSDISGLFLSVDPMADKYPSLSPYAYCAWNPIKAIDPDGKDSIVSIDLKTGYSSFNTSEESIGRQIVEYTQNGKVIDIYSCLGTIAVSQNNETNSIIEFSMASDANNVYDFLIGNNRCNMESGVEWNCYDKKDGSGMLVTSHMIDEIKVGNIGIDNNNASRLRHYHPGNQGLSLLPSKEDMIHAKSLEVPAFLSFCGKEYRFDRIVKDHGTDIPEGRLRELVKQYNNGIILFCR